MNMTFPDFVVSVSKSWQNAAALVALDAPSIKPVDMDEMQLTELAEAHIAMKTDLAFECAADFKQRLDDIRHTRWFLLLVKQTLVKKYNLSGMGI